MIAVCCEAKRKNSSVFRVKKNVFVYIPTGSQGDETMNDEINRNKIL
jgi:hypothetical protein